MSAIDRARWANRACVATWIIFAVVVLLGRAGYDAPESESDSEPETEAGVEGRPSLADATLEVAHVAQLRVGAEHLDLPVLPDPRASGRRAENPVEADLKSSPRSASRSAQLGGRQAIAEAGKRPAGSRERKSDGEAERVGRERLAQLEKGKGPSVMLHWPTQTSEREALHRAFVACYGMMMVIEVAEGRYYAHEGPWQLDDMKFSTWGIEVSPGSSPAEDRALASISRANPGARPGRFVRIFPRRVHERLLGGLARLASAGAWEVVSIEGLYRPTAGKVVVGSIHVNGVPVPGVLELAPIRSCGG